EKEVTTRVAVARSQVKMKRETLERIRLGTVGKGDVLAVAQVAGIMAAKKTWEIIPMCHPLPLTGIDIQFGFVDEETVSVEATVKTTGKTGVEMEALTAASVAVLTVYDMC
ncbi:cyclic pyranopterin monophosphate synthase MoaC, partial [Frankia sp. Cpl3]|nr:cyclic pyranopterin monophosphate synthase MoaC [Frankia sp. Cpl3]